MSKNGTEITPITSDEEFDSGNMKYRQLLKTGPMSELVKSGQMHLIKKGKYCQAIDNSEYTALTGQTSGQELNLSDKATKRAKKKRQQGEKIKTSDGEIIDDELLGNESKQLKGKKDDELLGNESKQLKGKKDDDDDDDDVSKELNRIKDDELNNQAKRNKDDNYGDDNEDKNKSYLSDERNLMQNEIDDKRDQKDLTEDELLELLKSGEIDEDKDSQLDEAGDIAQILQTLISQGYTPEEIAQLLKDGNLNKLFGSGKKKLLNMSKKSAGVLFSDEIRSGKIRLIKHDKFCVAVKSDELIKYRKNSENRSSNASNKSGQTKLPKTSTMKDSSYQAKQNLNSERVMMNQMLTNSNMQSTPQNMKNFNNKENNQILQEIEKDIGKNEISLKETLKNQEIRSSQQINNDKNPEIYTDAGSFSKDAMLKKGQIENVEQNKFDSSLEQKRGKNFQQTSEEKKGQNLSQTSNNLDLVHQSNQLKTGSTSDRALLTTSGRRGTEEEETDLHQFHKRGRALSDDIDQDRISFDEQNYRKSEMLRQGFELDQVSAEIKFKEKYDKYMKIRIGAIKDDPTKMFLEEDEATLDNIREDYRQSSLISPLGTDSTHFGESRDILDKAYISSEQSNIPTKDEQYLSSSFSKELSQTADELAETLTQIQSEPGLKTPEDKSELYETGELSEADDTEFTQITAASISKKTEEISESYQTESELQRLSRYTETKIPTKHKKIQTKEAKQEKEKKKKRKSLEQENISGELAKKGLVEKLYLIKQGKFCKIVKVIEPYGGVCEETLSEQSFIPEECHFERICCVCSDDQIPVCEKYSCHEKTDSELCKDIEEDDIPIDKKLSELTESISQHLKDEINTNFEWQISDVLDKTISEEIEDEFLKAAEESSNEELLKHLSELLLEEDQTIEGNEMDETEISHLSDSQVADEELDWEPDTQFETEINIDKALEETISKYTLENEVSEEDEQEQLLHTKISDGIKFKTSDKISKDFSSDPCNEPEQTSYDQFRREQICQEDQESDEMKLIKISRRKTRKICSDDKRIKVTKTDHDKILESVKVCRLSTSVKRDSQASGTSKVRSSENDKTCSPCKQYTYTFVPAKFIQDLILKHTIDAKALKEISHDSTFSEIQSRFSAIHDNSTEERAFGKCEKKICLSSQILDTSANDKDILKCKYKRAHSSEEIPKKSQHIEKIHEGMEQDLKKVCNLHENSLTSKNLVQHEILESLPSNQTLYKKIYEQRQRDKLGTLITETYQRDFDLDQTSEQVKYQQLYDEFSRNRSEQYNENNTISVLETRQISSSILPDKSDKITERKENKVTRGSEGKERKEYRGKTKDQKSRQSTDDPHSTPTKHAESKVRGSQLYDTPQHSDDFEQTLENSISETLKEEEKDEETMFLKTAQPSKRDDSNQEMPEISKSQSLEEESEEFEKSELKSSIVRQRSEHAKHRLSVQSDSDEQEQKKKYDEYRSQGSLHEEDETLSIDDYGFLTEADEERKQMSQRTFPTQGSSSDHISQGLKYDKTASQLEYGQTASQLEYQQLYDQYTRDRIGSKIQYQALPDQCQSDDVDIYGTIPEGYTCNPCPDIRSKRLFSELKPGLTCESYKYTIYPKQKFDQTPAFSSKSFNPKCQKKKFITDRMPPKANIIARDGFCEVVIDNKSSQQNAISHEITDLVIQELKNRKTPKHAASTPLTSSETLHSRLSQTRSKTQCKPYQSQRESSQFKDQQIIGRDKFPGQNVSGKPKHHNTEKINSCKETDARKQQVSKPFFHV